MLGLESVCKMCEMDKIIVYKYTVDIFSANKKGTNSFVFKIIYINKHMF